MGFISYITLLVDGISFETIHIPCFIDLAND